MDVFKEQDGGITEKLSCVKGQPSQCQMKSASAQTRGTRAQTKARAQTREEQRP